jgi:hypothetical protein
MEEEERRRKMHRKKLLANENMNEYYSHMLNKQKHQEEETLEKMRIKGQVSLEMNHEQRLNQMKDYFMRLNEKVENNMSRYQVNSGKYNQSRTHQNLDFENTALTNNYNYEDRLTPPSSNTNNNINGDNNIDQQYYDNNSSAMNTGNQQYFYPESKPIKSDVTSNYVFDRLNNKDYQFYKDINQNYFTYNKGVMDNIQKIKEGDYQNKRYQSMERVKDIDRYNQANYEARQFKNEQQNLYRHILDNQVRVKENIVTGFRDEKVPVSPCNIYFNIDRPKDYSLGYSSLERHPILNPVPDYKYNKYLNREAYPRFNNAFQYVGNNIIN